jgi:hypothetical protein
MAWKKSTLKHSQTFSCAKLDFMDMLFLPNFFGKNACARFAFMDMLREKRRGFFPSLFSCCGMAIFRLEASLCLKYNCLGNIRHCRKALRRSGQRFQAARPLRDGPLCLKHIH